MDTFKITSGNHFIFVDQIPEDFDRNDYTVYGNGENYNMYRNQHTDIAVKVMSVFYNSY